MLTEASRVHDRRWVTQCALSRICGGCAMSLGRPVAFLGTPDEVARNAFHLPPLHVACAEELRLTPGADPTLAAGHDVWVRVRPAGARGPRPGAPVRAQLAHRWVPAIGSRCGWNRNVRRPLPPLLEALGLVELEHNPRNNRVRAL